MDDFDVISGGKVVGRIFRPGAGAPRDVPWMWSILDRSNVRGPYLGYEDTRAAAMAAFAKSWRGE